MRAVRRPEDDSLTGRRVAGAVGHDCARWPGPRSTTSPKSLWSQTDSDTPAGVSAARPLVDFVPEEASGSRRPSAAAWYRPILVTAGVFAAMVLVGTGAVMAIRNDASAMTGTATTTTTLPARAARARGGPADRARGRTRRGAWRTVLHQGGSRADDPRRGLDATAGDLASPCARGRPAARG